MFVESQSTRISSYEEEVFESHRWNRARMNLAPTGSSDARKWVGEDLGVGAIKSDCPYDVFR
jgi:hypothetical protein